MTDETYTGSPLEALYAVLGAASSPSPDVPAPGKPGVGLVLGPGGVGKTGLLVHFGLYHLLRAQQVLHVSLRDTVEHARAHCDEVLRSVRDRNRLGDALVRIERGRMIHSFAGQAFDLAMLERNLDVLGSFAQFSPAVALIDGFEPAALAAALDDIRGMAVRRGLWCWISVRLADVAPGQQPYGPLDPARADLAVRMVPEGRAVKLHALGRPFEAALSLDPSTLAVLNEDVLRTNVTGTEVPLPVQARDCTLYSGGAVGAEAAFGAAAERWGAHEVNFTFEGHLQARDRGRYELSPKELAVGDVSLVYVSKRLSRSYNDKGGLIRGVLQTLWHMVSRSQQVFVIGQIQQDGTVVGGTGWSVELARMWSRDLWVFDQDEKSWFRWDGVGWTTGLPRITSVHFCGTGTRYLSPEGRAAIDELFRRSFG